MNNDEVYINIMKNLDEAYHRAPRSGDHYSKAFIDYLKLLYSPEEAELVQYLKVPREVFPMGLEAVSYRCAAQIANDSGKDKDEVRNTLNELSKKKVILGLGSATGEKGLKAASTMSKMTKVLLKGAENPSLIKIISAMLGFIRQDISTYGIKGATEFSLYAIPHLSMLVNHHSFAPEIEPDDLKAAELYQEFFIKDELYKRYEGSDQGTPVGRAIVVNKSVEYGEKILDWEEAHKVIETADHIQLVPCPCRTRTEKMGTRECKDQNPVGACIMMGMSAVGMESMGRGVECTTEEAKKYLDEMMTFGLVAHTENHQHPLYNIICLCCECCCSQTRGRTRWDNPTAIAPSNFIPKASDDCKMCGKCVKRCMFDALEIDEEYGKVVVDDEKCIGCGICTIGCKKEALKLHRFERSKPFSSPQELYRTIESENKTYDDKDNLKN
jgi:ferredoxin